MEIHTSAPPKMARTYFMRSGYKVYEVGYPVGDDAVYFVLIDGQRHYFKTLTQAELYLSRIQDSAA